MINLAGLLNVLTLPLKWLNTSDMKLFMNRMVVSLGTTTSNTLNHLSMLIDHTELHLYSMQPYFVLAGHFYNTETRYMEG